MCASIIVYLHLVVVESILQARAWRSPRAWTKSISDAPDTFFLFWTISVVHMGVVLICHSMQLDSVLHNGDFNGSL